MNKQQRAVLVLAIALVGATGLFPPWVYVIHLRMASYVTRPAGFAWLLQRPEVTSLNPTATPKRTYPRLYEGPGGGASDSSGVDRELADVRIDWDTLKVEWGVILLASTGLCVLLHGNRRDQPGRGHKWGARISGFMAGVRKWVRRSQGKQVNISNLRPKPAPHWALDILADYGGDLDWAIEQADRALGFNCFYVGPHEALFGINFDEPDIPTWFPREYDSRTLSREERISWFDELLRFYGPVPKEWPPNVHVGIKQVRVLEALLQIYEAMVTGRLQDREGPGFTRNKQQSARSSEGRGS